MSFTDYPQAIQDLADEIFEIADSKGFWDYNYPLEAVIPLKLALVHSEVSEALEVHRRFYDDDEADPVTTMTPLQEDMFAEEIADVVIRCLDLIGGLSIDNFGEIVVSKIEKNRGRSRLHAKRF